MNTQQCLIANYVSNKKFKHLCSICAKRSKTTGTLPCSICNNLIHKKCSKTMRFKIDLKFKTNWICSVCRDEIFPFQNCLFDDLTETKYQDYMDTEIDISKIQNEYNFSHTLNENDEDGKLEINYCQVHCDFYDVNEFKNITKTLTKKTF